ncbi:MAG: hypothetical protein ACI9BW_001848 [Gammaproteobacteria bacterium]|jgi:hypothetical protein
MRIKSSWLLIAILLVFLRPVGAQDASLEKLTSTSVKKLLFLTSVHERTWGISHAKSWNIDQGKGKIFWTFPNGRIVEAPVQIVGTYDPQTSTFLWSWANHSILSSMQTSASHVREYGNTHGIGRFTTNLIKISEHEAWRLTATATHLAKAKGAYRAQAGGAVVFVTFGNVKVSNNQP